MSDLISRQAIMKHIENLRHDALMMDDLRRASIIMNGMHLCEEEVRNQPSVKLEPLTDTEQRIFLTAMGREEKVCKKKYRRLPGPYKDSLFKACREIERKVKKALWTN